jgi:hypothetical protein
MNILDPIFYRTLFYDFRPVISPGKLLTTMLWSHRTLGVKDLVELNDNYLYSSQCTGVF